MNVLHLVIAESSLETVPKEIADHPIIQRDAWRRRRDPSKIILDRSRHHEAMTRLEDSHKRGRPDIVYLTLQVTQYTPLNVIGMLRTYIHTINDYLIYIKPQTRIPHNYNNFIGLFEQLFEIGRVPPQGEPLIWLERGKIRTLLDKIRPDIVFLLDDVKGRESSFREFATRLLTYDEPCIIVGGFPHGSFSEDTYSIANEIVRLGKHRYTTLVITAKLLTHIESILNIE
ncbi:MAG: hypothetical protein GXO23_06570 [Crenarchaeota archaeon]|nr:hypothetical protein [Thermoproteota archaeon]